MPGESQESFDERHKHATNEHGGRLEGRVQIMESLGAFLNAQPFIALFVTIAAGYLLPAFAAVFLGVELVLWAQAKWPRKRLR